MADQQVDWDAILVDGADAMEGGEYFTERVNQVLDGDIDTYFEIIADINPFDDLISYGSGFDCGTDDPRMMAVHFIVNSRAVLGGAEPLRTEQYNELLEDYVCGCAIRVARDMLALLPVRYVIVDASESWKTILSVDITRRDVEGVDFAEVDPSGFIRSLNYHKKAKPLTFKEYPIDSMN